MPDVSYWIYQHEREIWMLFCFGLGCWFGNMLRGVYDWEHIDELFKKKQEERRRIFR